jgi:trehalose 6-phosphate synthase/phosphatase
MAPSLEPARTEIPVARARLDAPLHRVLIVSARHRVSLTRPAGLREVVLIGDALPGTSRPFVNAVLRPLFHDLPPDATAATADWEAFRAVNERFADAVLREWRPGDDVWVHDFDLLLLPRLLRERRPEARIAFFLHTPFPRLGSLAALPWAAELVRGVLGADAVGFQTQADLKRFAIATRAVAEWPCESAAGSGLASDHGRPVCLHVSPSSVDVAAFAGRAADPRVRRRVEALRAGGGPLFVGIDRLDPAKGIPRRLEAFGRMLEAHPELRGRARLLQLAAPSRDGGPAGLSLRLQVECQVAALNARFGTAEWAPIACDYEPVDPLELSARYRAADVLLATPLRDGMSLVAKEFVASRTDESGVLVLSKQAGAAAELTTALLVDPDDLDGMAAGFLAAAEMGPAERRVRMRRLRARVKAHDVHCWVRECLHELRSVGRLARSAS